MIIPFIFAVAMISLLIALKLYILVGVYIIGGALTIGLLTALWVEHEDGLLDIDEAKIISLCGALWPLTLPWLLVYNIGIKIGKIFRNWKKDAIRTED